MGAEPFSGYVFVFRNRRITSIKIFHLKSRHSYLQYTLQFLLKEVFLYQKGLVLKGNVTIMMIIDIKNISLYR